MTLFKKRETIDKSELMFSGKALVKMMIPLMLQQMLNMTVGMINSIMVSNAGDAAVSAVSLIGTMDGVLILFFTALVTGGSVVISQAIGKGDAKSISDATKQLLYSSTLMACLLTTVVLTFRTPLLNLLFGSVEEAVMTSAHDYFIPIALTFPLLAITESVHAGFRAEGKTFISLIVSLATNILNIVGNLIFVIALEMGARGAALSTACMRLIATVVLLALIHDKRRVVHVEHLLHYKPDFKAIRKILHIGVPYGVEQTLFQFGRLLTTTLIAMLPTAMIAAQSVALNLANYQYAVNTAFCCAAIPIVGRCIGAGREDQAKYYSRLLVKLEYVMMWAVILVTVVFLRPLLSTYDVSATAKDVAYWLVISHSAVVALIYPLGFFYPAVFRAASDVRFCMVVSIASMWLVRIAFAYVLALETVSVMGLFSFPGFGMGIWGVWLAMMLDWVVRTVLYTVRFVTDKWLRVGKKLRGNEA